MKKLLWICIPIVILLSLVILLPSQIVHVFCALDQTCTWTGTQTFAGISSLNSIQFVDGVTNGTIQAAINKLPVTGGLVYLPASNSEYACPSSIPSNVGLIGMTPFADSSFVGSINPSPNVTNTQVWIGPCGAVTAPTGAQNIRLQNLTLDFNNSGNGLTFTSVTYLQLVGITIRGAGNSVTPALSLLATNGNGNTAHPLLENVSIQCNTSGFCSSALYMNAGTTTAVTNAQVVNLSVTGNVKCGIQLEQNTDTNRFFGGNMQAVTWVANSAPFCFNLTNPTIDIDANASEFYGIGITGAPTWIWNAGQSQGHIFIGLNTNAPVSATFHTAGGTPNFPAVIGGGGGTGSVNIFGNSLKTSDEGFCTMSSGTCTAQTFNHTYAANPQCLVTWTGTGTLTGLLKTTISTTQVIPLSSVGSDSAQVSWICFGS